MFFMSSEAFIFTKFFSGYLGLDRAISPNSMSCC
ncbi:MAG: hypothetical protein ACI9VT_003958 [Psychroserpens sp.]